MTFAMMVLGRMLFFIVIRVDVNSAASQKLAAW
jgi:hypothetical protein